MLLGDVEVHSGRGLSAQIPIFGVEPQGADHVCAARARKSYAAPDAINEIELHVSD
jgi:hypothetical protein